MAGNRLLQKTSKEDRCNAVTSFLEQHDSHVFDSSLPSLRTKATLTTCTQTSDQVLQKRAAVLLRNVMFDCTGYFFHMRRVNVKPEAKLERDPFRVQRYTVPTEVFDCQGDLHITMSKVYESRTMVSEHKCHMETDKFPYDRREKTDLHTITRQQVYNFWLSITKSEWERDAANDFRSAQLVVREQGGFQLIEGLQEPGKYSRAKMTEVFVDSTFGTNKHGYELYCVLTEYDLVSPPLSYLLLDTRKVTAASIAFRTNNSKYNHHLCLWQSLRAIDQYITGKARGRGLDSADTVRTSTRSTVSPSYLHFLTEKSNWMLSKGETKNRHLLRHPLLRSVPASLVYESYDEINASSDKDA
ncbi:hypothetical protein V1508DRAFT_405722 [Lipomyces doorenjongii]|uniref:uncharacterized protein n=1 Tax=Lipomyces doorenjongii TaxID=383834 RepID=UPI0034CDBC60